MPRGRTHSALRFLVQLKESYSFIDRWNSFWRTFRVIELFWVPFLPSLGDPATLIEVFSHDDNIVAQDALGHPHPVNFDVGGKIIPSPGGVLVDCSVVGDVDGHHN